MKKYVKICPLCGSTNITHRIIGEALIRDKCKTCGHDDYSFPEVTKTKIKEFREKIKKPEPLTKKYTLRNTITIIIVIVATAIMTIGFIILSRAAN